MLKIRVAALSLLWTAAATSVAWGQQQTLLLCQATANPPVLRSEGVSERVGDMNLQCTGGQPNARITGNLSIFLSINITNRLNENDEVNVFLTIDNGSGAQPANVPARLASANTITYYGLSFTLSPQGTVNLRISNVRGAAYLAGIDTNRPITASLAFNAGSLLSLQANTLTVGTALRGLLSSQTSKLICSYLGSPAPAGTSISSAVQSGTVYSTMRVTEGFPHAFSSITDFASLNGSNGTRIIVRYTGVPLGVRLYAPDGIVGTDGQRATSAGDYGYSASGGTYQAGSGSLLLARVLNPNADGSGGSLAAAPFSSGLSFFENISEISTLADGTAVAVYEVLDGNPNVIQSALIPTFLSVFPNVVNRFTEIAQTVSYGPISSTPQPSMSAPIPRFQAYPTLNDCRTVGDCSAPYFPKMAVNTSSVDVTMSPGQIVENRYFTIANSGSGNFLWNANVEYITGHDWLRLSPNAGVNRETVRMDFVPGNLPPGRYEAIIRVTAGSEAGNWTIQARMNVPVQPVPPPVISIITHAASETPVPIVPGSLALITGLRLQGNQTDVTFNGFPARITSASPTRLIVQVPIEVAGLPNTFVIVKVDGVFSVGALVGVVDANPIIFPNAVLNQDYSIDSESKAAETGSVIQVFATGLPLANVYTARIHDRVIEEPVFAGAAPGLVGIHQFNLTIPADLPTMTTDVYVCGGVSKEEQVCSPSHPITMVNRNFPGTAAAAAARGK